MLTPDPVKMLQEAFRVTKSKGRVGFSVWGKKEEFTMPFANFD